MNFVEISVLVFVGLFVAYNLSVLLSSRRQKGQLISDITGECSDQEMGWQVYYFYSPNCGACRNMTPVLKQFELENNSVHCVDVSAKMELARKFNVRATPTAILIEDAKISKVLLGTGLLKQVNQFITEHENDKN